MKNLSVAILSLAIPLTTFANDAEDRVPRTGAGVYSCVIEAYLDADHHYSGSLDVVAQPYSSVATAMYGMDETYSSVGGTRGSRDFKRLPQVLRDLRFGVGRIYDGSGTVGTYLQAEIGRRAANGEPNLVLAQEFPRLTRPDGVVIADVDFFVPAAQGWFLRLYCSEANN